MGGGAGRERRREAAVGGSDAGRAAGLPLHFFFQCVAKSAPMGIELASRGAEWGGRGWRSDVRDDPKNIGRWMGMSPSWKSCGSLISMEVDFCVCLFGCTKIFLLSRGHFLRGRSLI